MEFEPYRRSATRRGLTVLELLICVVIVATLLAMMLPAVMHARELTRQAQCSNNLRQFGFALHQYHDHSLMLPRAWGISDNDRRFAESWGRQILPELEASSLACELASSNGMGMLESYSHATRLQLNVFLCASDIIEPAFELLAAPSHSDEHVSLTNSDLAEHSSRFRGYLPTANYVAVYGTVEADDFEEVVVASGQTFGDGSIINDRGIRFAELQRGTSQTLLVGERKMAMVPSTWLGVDLDGEDAACRLTGAAITRPNCEPCDECEFSSRHAGGSSFLWADGHVSLITDSVDTHLYRQSAKRRNEY